MSKLSRIKDSLGRVKLDQKGQPIMAFKQPPEDTVTYVTSSGNVRVVYYPLRGDAKIGCRRFGLRTERSFPYGDWDDEDSVLLAPQDAIEIGIYLLGLQPHIRDVLARKDKTQDVQNVEYPTQDIIDEE